MSLPYKVWTEDEIKNRNVSEAGDYNFRILNVTKKRTQTKLDDKGQPKPTYEMWEVEFEFVDNNGVVKKTKDWIVFCEGMDWKLRHIANTVGKIELYDAHKLDAHHLINASGVFSLGVKDYEKNGEKLKQNFIKDYVKKSAIAGNDNSFINDDIPL